jgi:hypothetical protein
VDTNDPAQPASTDPLEITAGNATDSAARADGAATTATAPPSAPGSATYCHACGEQVDPRAFVCPKCGVKQRGSGGSGEGIEPALAAVVALITSPVIGMMLVKRWALAALYAVVILIGVVTSPFLIGIPILLGAWIGGIFHVYSIANQDRNG